MMSKLGRCILLAVLLSQLTACDPDRHKKCEWYLVPEPDHRELVGKGWVSLCARNFTTNKQRCFLQSELDFAKKMYGQAFIFDTLETDKSYPRKILNLKTCTPKT